MYPGWDYFPNTKAIPGTNDAVGHFVENDKIVLANIQPPSYALIRIGCSNNRNDLLRFYPVTPKDGRAIFLFLFFWKEQAWNGLLASSCMNQETFSSGSSAQLQGANSQQLLSAPILRFQMTDM